MLHTEGVGIFLYRSETVDERIGKAVGDLQTHTEEHGEDEENRHVLLLEEREGTKPERIHEALLVCTFVDRTFRQCEGVEEQHDAENARSDELVLIVLESHEIHKPHGADETDGSKHADRWEVLHGVHSRFRESIICHGVGECQRWHVESNAQGIEREDRTKLCVLAVRITIPRSAKHEQASQEMAVTQQALSRNPAVGNDTDDGRHEDGNDALHRVEPTNLGAQSDVAKITTHASEISSPHSKLQEVHHNQANFQRRTVHILSF